MTRQKKSRKPPQEAVKTRLSKKEKQQIAELRDKKPKKQTGKKPGNRQQEAVTKNRNKNSGQENKDPRLGSKKPIDLGVPAVKAQLKPKKTTKSTSGVAAIRVVDETLSIPAQIAEIEQDETLLAIIAKQEDDIALTEQEVDYYNQMMERHEALSEQLPTDETPSTTDKQLDEDDLWDKLDKTDFSEYQ